ncbi:T9SS type A sorting domain-containing protein [Brumimicrobium aurantiacum]|nr:T9SS type A sorting domain-containing protein [Brumimicrobium aurantiacum]
MGGGLGLGVGGTPSVTNTPQQISMDKWISFSTGTGTSFGVKEDGTLWAWGVNTNGQLGDGTSTDRLVPTQIGNNSNWSKVQARNYATTMATKTDGTVWYWGLNYYGEFGNGSSYGTAYYNTPTQTQGICVTSTTGGGPTYIPATIAGVTGSDASGVGTSVGDSVAISGVVHCQNFSSSGYDITLIDANNDGITLSSPTDINGYIPTEGDEIEVEGEITQVNGLIQIKPDNIAVLQQGAALQSPTLTTVLDETTESQLVRLENLELVNGEAMWPSDGNIAVTNTVDTFTVRVTASSALAGTPTPGTYFHLTGLGKQYDTSSPYDEGYQIYPCGVDPYCDIDISTTLNNETLSVNDTGHTYQWINCADSSVITGETGETGETFTPTANGDYAVIITQGPCVDTSACVFVDVLGLEGNELNGISVYPNPITDELNINNENGTVVSMEMIDAKGSVVVTSQVESKEFKLNTSDLKPGVYVLVLRSEKSVKAFKVVK